MVTGIPCKFFTLTTITAPAFTGLSTSTLLPPTSVFYDPPDPKPLLALRAVLIFVSVVAGLTIVLSYAHHWIRRRRVRGGIITKVEAPRTEL